MTASSMSKIANEIAEKWGPALTKSYQDGNVAPFQDLFVQEPVEVVLQATDGVEAVFSVGNSEDAALSWAEFHELSVKDLKEQDYAKTESLCLGVLGDRFIMETGRLNKSGEVYMEAYHVVTFNSDGKIIGLEAFSDSQLASVTSGTTTDAS